ncbi:MAG TPA: TetR/AcrR family transcriptional regulator [Anaerolineales bacterium]|nr:TetR/AcrR family transcriptional regulator [Anaerolineales bacterium]
MPKLWNDTIKTHRHEVREAILDATADLVSQSGLLSVTMAQIAEDTGIGRATLYKYFSGVEEILFAWHERQVRSHFKQLVEIRNQAGTAGERLAAVVEAYALIARENGDHTDSDLAALLHRDQHLARAQKHLKDLFKGLLIEAAREGHVRGDVEPGELASFCLHALAGARSLPSKAAVRRLVTLTLAGLRTHA